MASIVVSIFIGGEFKDENKNLEPVYRLMVSGEYEDEYDKGEMFVFNKEEANVKLVIKDPKAEEKIKVEELVGDDYGFKINGEGRIYLESYEIIVNKDIEKISVVSLKYPTVSYDIVITVNS